MAKVYTREAVSKCFPLTAGFKIKEGDPAKGREAKGDVLKLAQFFSA